MAETPLTLLLVEDNPGDARLIQALLLEEPGGAIRLEWVKRLDAGLERLDRPGPRVDCLLLDLGLPDSQGRATYQAALGGAPGVPIVLLTGLHDEALAGEAVRAGVQDYLQKGQVDGPLLRRAIRYAIERKAASEALALQTRRLEAVRVVAEEITRELDLQTLLALIIRRAAELVGAGSGEVFLWDEAAERLVPSAGWGVRFAGERPRRLGEGLAGAAAQQRAGLIENDYQRSPHRVPWLEGEGRLTAGMAQPLLYQARLLGTLGFSNVGTGRPFNPEDLAVTELLAAQAAIAIENARLYQAVQSHAATLEARVAERTRELVTALERAQAASQAKSEFLANMSHELRTPLNAILGFCQLLREQGDITPPERQARYLANIQGGGELLLRLVTAALDIAASESGSLALQLERVPVGPIVEAAAAAARQEALAKGLSLEVDVAPDLPPTQADPARLRQICQSLLDNAVKFTPAGGTVRVAARNISDFQFPICDWKSEESGPQSQIANRKSEMVEIAVADTGIGIRPEELSRLFLPFQQLEAPATKRHAGTGVGLALAKKLVELHGGTITAESAGEGLGATFRVRLPIADQPAASRRQ